MAVNNFSRNISDEDLEKINKFTRKPLTSDDVAIFEVTLCDNEVDKDFEHFDKDTLEMIRTLSVGNLGVLYDVSYSTDQIARIYDCQINESNKLTQSGEYYKKVVAKAYIILTPNNSSLVKKLSSSPVEVSISGSIKECTCSICGQNMRVSACRHIKGKKYKGKLCYGVLSGMYDFLEWSLKFKSDNKKDNNERCESIMNDDIQRSFTTLEDVPESNSGNLILSSKSKWDKIICELVKEGYAVRTHKDEFDNIHIDYFQLQY